MLQSSFVWTDDAGAEAVEMWREGKSISDIANFFSISRGAVSGFINRNRELFAARPSGAGYRQDQKPKQKQAPKTTWTEERIAQAAALWVAGVASGEIAKAVGCTDQAFYTVSCKNRERFPRRAKVMSQTMPAAPRPQRQPRQEPQAPDSASPRSSMFDFSYFLLPDVLPVPFMAIQSGQCRFPVDGPNDSRGALMPCCGAKTNGPVYCAVHARVSAGRGTESERSAHKTLRRAGV